MHQQGFHSEAVAGRVAAWRPRKWLRFTTVTVLNRRSEGVAQLAEDLLSCLNPWIQFSTLHYKSGEGGWYPTLWVRTRGSEVQGYSQARDLVSVTK